MKKLTLPFSSAQWLAAWTSLKDYIVNGTFAAKFIRHDTVPFVLVADEEQKCKRFFHTEEEAAAYYEARANNALTPEIQAYNFTPETVPGKEQYKVSCVVINDGAAQRYGTTVKLQFRFVTTDQTTETALGEAVEIYFTFAGENKTVSKTERFAYSGGITEYDITDYLGEGTTSITMVVRGLSTGLSTTVNPQITLVNMPLTSSFDISEAINEGENINVGYSVGGTNTKTVYFYLDGTLADTAVVAAGQQEGLLMSLANSLSPGVHTLQIKAEMIVNTSTFKSDWLYYEFVVNGEGLDLTTTLISATFDADNGLLPFIGHAPGLQGEQYVKYKLVWAYFSTDSRKASATVVWKTFLNEVETVVGTRDVDEKSGQISVMPDPVEFQPSDAIPTGQTYNVYDLKAYIKDTEEEIGAYTITVVKNTAGLSEVTNALEMKLTAIGRSNSEPEDTRSEWQNNGYTTAFTDMSFSDLSGYTGSAVRFDGGATGVNTCKPFASERQVIKNGMAMFFDFMTRNVEDESIPLIEIGDSSKTATAYFAIYGKKVVLKPSTGESLEYQFATGERTHLGVIVMPKDGVTDEQMMFFTLNGVEAPGKQYASTAVFNIGSTASSDELGMIKFGDSTGKAAIDVYNVRVYTSIVTMWGALNNYMIDAVEDIASEWAKNEIFLNNNIETPNVTLIKQNYRTFEFVGPLGDLEEATSKISITGSCYYTDPIAPEFNFYREDGKVVVETAGQSRLEDLMAKSFHVDLNDDETQVTYDRDGNVKYKNRVIFAKGNVPENSFRIDLCGADSSICRCAAHFKMVNKYYPYVQVGGEYVLRTPAQHYAMEQYSSDYAEKFGGEASDYPFPYNLNIAPDSVPVVILWHETEDDPIKVYGLGMMTEEKKASYANGNHSIYLKPVLEDGTYDPLDRFAGSKGDRGWDNAGTIEMEFIRGSVLTYSSDVSDWTEETREASYELCFPKKKDLTEEELEETWQTFYTEFVKALGDTYQNQEAFEAAIGNIIDIDSFCMYYNKVMDKKCNDSLCRNLHVLRVNRGTTDSPDWKWYAKWWDVDVETGLYMSGAMGVPVDTDRNSMDARGNYIMSGRDADGSSMWLWDGLENWQYFQDRCKVIAEAAYAAGWTCENDKDAQDAIVDYFSPALYDLDGLQKYLAAFRKGNDYMIRMQGSSTPYRHGFLDDAYNIREAQMAIGGYANRAVSFYAQGSKNPDAVRIIASAHTWFGMGLTTTNYVTGVEKSPSDGEFSMSLPESVGALGKDPLRIYGADKMAKIDISDFMGYIYGTINLTQLTNCQQLILGRSHDVIATKGFNAATDIQFAGLSGLTKLTEVNIAGYHGIETFDISEMTRLAKFYAAGSGLKTFEPASGVVFTALELPDTLQTLTATKCTLGGLSFWKADLSAKTVTEMTECPASLLELTLVGMGSDEGTHTLVHMWCEMLRNNPDYIGTAQITYKNINWDGITKEDLFTLASIPSAQREDLTGYVKVSEAYTAQERQTLAEAFGSEVFEIGATSRTLVCDCPGDGVTVSATGETVTTIDATHITAEQGNAIQFVGAGFPLAEHNYLWRAYVNGAWAKGTVDVPEIPIDTGVTLNRSTGVLTTTENSNAETEYRINCYDAGNTAINGDMYVTVMQRSYPTEAAISLKSSQQPVTIIDNQMQITEQGVYIFGATNKRIVEDEEVDYTGRKTETDGDVWTLENQPDCVEISTDGDQLTFTLASKPTDEYQLALKYVSKWRNGLSLTAEELSIVIAAVINQLLVNDEDEGNPILYEAVKAIIGDPATAGYFTSQELKKVLDTFSVKTVLPSAYTQLTSLMSEGYFIPQYLKNVEEFDFSDCSALAGDYDISLTPQADILNLSGTATRNVTGLSSHDVQTVKMAAPTIISISNCPNLVINE